jgi:hypothetical protein
MSAHNISIYLYDRHLCFGLDYWPLARQKLKDFYENLTQGDLEFFTKGMVPADSSRSDCFNNPPV